MPNSLESLFTPLGKALRNRRSGEKLSVLAREGWDGEQSLTVTSTAYEHGECIPDKYSAMGRGQNISPQFAWSNVPAETQQFLLVFEDVDLPLNIPGLHCIALAPHDVREVAEGDWTTKNVTMRWVPTHGGMTRGYSGPRPLAGHGRHHYRLHVFALSEAIPASVDLPKIDALDAHVAGRVLARGMLSGFQDG